MNKDLYSNTDFTELKKQLNREIQRRGTFKWWDPLTTPSVGQDRSTTLTIPEEGKRFLIDDKTYTINNPSEGSIERTKNVEHPKHGENPAGADPSDETSVPNTSAAAFTVNEMRNYLVGLSKIQDINLFYGRDEIEFLAFRDPSGIEEAINNAANSELNALLKDSGLSETKNDPNGGIVNYKSPRYPNETKDVTYPMEYGQYVMPSGEYDGEEVSNYGGPNEQNFFDDYGAPKGEGDFHPMNPNITTFSDRSWDDQGHNRDSEKTKAYHGGIKSSSYGANPRNPNQGKEYRSRPVYGGVPGSCQGACTGLCFQTCDNECSESCTTTCFSRCGNACTSTCGNVCTGCSTMCYSSCKTKCENSTGYSCLKAGAKTVKIYTSGGTEGEPASNHIEATYYSCQQCSYSCQFYPNKKTTCWDADCMSKCFTSCTTSCSASCHGGCIDNANENNGTYKGGKGRGCSAGCTINCVGACEGVCQGLCTNTCWHGCKQTCSDNCSYECSTNCGHGCEQSCMMGCKDECTGNNSSKSCDGGCTSMCQNDCNGNCIGWGCKSICGIESQGACESNCRMNCMSSSCTSLCSDACSSQCTSCVNTCGFQCGACTTQCSTSCGAACNITCTSTCEHSCEVNCVHSCTETCGGCSNLCYSCVGMCIGVCSVKCQDMCSNCANMCSWWCDTSCNRGCFSNCVDRCINNCTGSCATFLTSETKTTVGPERDPISNGYQYPHPQNRWEERESFKIMKEIAPYTSPASNESIEAEESSYLVRISFDDENNLDVQVVDGLTFVTYSTTLIGGVWNVDSTTGDITVNEEFLGTNPPANRPSLDGNEGVFVVQIKYNESIPITEKDVSIKLPFGFEPIGPLCTSVKDTVYIIQRHITK